MAVTDTIELIWDFRGPDAASFAKHHAKHLQEFMAAEKRSISSGFRVIDDNYALAYIQVPATDLLFYRDRLKPQRGNYV